MNKRIIYFFFFLSIICSCKKTEEDKEEVKIKTPVEVTSIKLDTFVLSKTFKGITYYLTDGDIKSPISGYVTNIYIKIGDKIHRRTPLFGVETKEAYVLKGKNYLNDPTLKNIGQAIIYSPEDGIINLVLAEENEYVQEGTLLGTYSAPDMFVFLIEVPAEQDSSIKIGKPCTISLPNGKNIKGKIARTLGRADSLSQTERYIVNPDDSIILPAGLQLKISFIEYEKANAKALPKESVLSNETQTEFWVMKLINDSTAIKTTVKTGLQNDNLIEILEPHFSMKDRIITKGNYGLSDTAIVQIKKSKDGK